VRVLFTDETHFQKFLAGEDYSYGLADVPDREFEAKWDAVYQAIKTLVGSGAVQEGAVVELPTVPHNSLRDTPLMDGEWLDRYVAALAEWGARLQGQGYQLEEPDDSHPLAWYRIFDPEAGAEADVMVLKQIWQQTEKHLGRFPGRTRDIQGRPYLHYPDYLRWRGRKAKGDLQSGLRRGLVLSSWNRWVGANGGDGSATLESVKASCLTSYLEVYRYHLCRDSDDEMEEKRRRESLLQNLQGWKPGSRSDDRCCRRIGDWKEMAGNFLGELYSLLQAAETISQRYFDCRQLLFPSRATDFTRLGSCMEQLLREFNEDFSNTFGQETELGSEGLEAVNSPSIIDIAALQGMVTPPPQQQTTFLVDLAKAGALDAMGENRAAVGLLDRHI
jgi:hypothetical protein